MKSQHLLDTHLLHTFVTIAESSSLTDAARRLGVTQSAISQALKQLEEDVGVELVVRRTRPMQLTVAGVAMKQQADRVLGELRRLGFAVRAAADKGLLQCRLGLISSFSEVLGSTLIARLQPLTEQLHVKSGTTPDLKAAFLNREIDVLISDSPLAEIDGLERFALFRDPFLLAVPELWVSGEPMSLDALTTTYPMIRYSRQSQMSVHVDVALRRLHLQTQARFETDESHTLMSLVRDQHGWAMLTALCLVQTLHKVESVRILEMDRSRHARVLYLVTRQGELGDLPNVFAQTITDIFHETVYPQLQDIAPWIQPEHFHTDQVVL